MNVARRIAVWLAGASILVGVVHCNGELGDHCGGSSSVATGRDAGVCPANQTYGGPDGGPACTTLADCPASTGFQACLQGRCSVDFCVSDGDCPNGQACGCSNLYYGGNAAIHPNACVASHCRVDADCGAGGICSASIGPGCGSLDGYYCHSSADECHTSADCCSDKPLCRYQPQLGHWACQAQFACNG
jgi:hypothetical protein